MKAVLLGTIIGILPAALAAHGEDKLGPHKGYIRMPGGFHTEVKIQKNELIVYLLDIDWKNPTTKNSSVQVDYTNDDKKSSLTCEPKKSDFSCPLPESFTSKKGRLSVTAIREGMKGAVAEYVLPLKLFKAVEDSHPNHH